MYDPRSISENIFMYSSGKGNRLMGFSIYEDEVKINIPNLTIHFIQLNSLHGMASYTGADKEMLCAICADRYCAPRKLPGCVHSFCEKCILNLVINLKKDDKQGMEFECPVSRLPSKSPQEGNITLEWVQTMEKDKELEPNIEKKFGKFRMVQPVYLSI